MKKDIYFITVAKKNEDGIVFYEEDLQYFDEDFSICNEKCQEICDKLGLEGISFLKIGIADILTENRDFDKLRDERIHYEVKHNDLQK